MKKAFILLSLTGIVMIYSCKKDNNDSKEEETTTGTTGDERQKAIDDYKNNYLTSDVTTAELAWTGDANNCVAGTISQPAQDRVIQRINYFRRQAGYTEAITLDATKSVSCQEGALMMKANSALSHDPPTNWKCYSAAGANSAGNSNISLGSHSTSSITGQMRDAGSGNFAAGHRRWILYSGLQTAGQGSTDVSSNLYVLHNFGNDPAAGTPEFIAWPRKGYAINALVFPRWSFGIPGADFSNATVTMSSEGTDIPLTEEQYSGNSYGDNTIVWVPQLPSEPTDMLNDTKFTVTVGNVSLNGQTKSYTYDVTVINP